MSVTKTWSEGLGKVLFAIGFCGWLAAVCAFIYLHDLTSSSPPVPDAAHSVSFAQHGHAYYVTPAQYNLFWGMLVGGGILGTACLAVGSVLMRGDKFYWSSADMPPRRRSPR